MCTYNIKYIEHFYRETGREPKGTVERRLFKKHGVKTHMVQKWWRHPSGYYRPVTIHMVWCDRKRYWKRMLIEYPSITRRVSL